MINPQLQKASIIKNKRSIAISNDTKELQQKREKFLGFFNVNNWNPPIQVFEMYPADVEGGAIKGIKQIPQYLNEYKFANTRLKIKSETGTEIDHLSWKETLKVISHLCKRLIQFEFHFVIFCSEGSRSPHIRIYDLLELEDLNSYQRELAQQWFWKRIAGNYYSELDKSILADNHPLQLEFAIHWRTGNPFVLIYEHIPQRILKREGEKQTQL